MGMESNYREIAGNQPGDLRQWELEKERRRRLVVDNRRQEQERSALVRGRRILFRLNRHIHTLAKECRSACRRSPFVRWWTKLRL